MHQREKQGQFEIFFKLRIPLCDSLAFKVSGTLNDPIIAESCFVADTGFILAPTQLGIRYRQEISDFLEVVYCPSCGIDNSIDSFQR